MIYGRLQVDPPSGGEALPPYLQQADFHPGNGFPRLNGRLSLSEHSVTHNSFDSIRLCFRGVIISSIGGKSTLEDIITLTDVKSIADFEPAQNSASQTRHVGFYFEVPTNVSSSEGKLRALPLTTSISGTTGSSQHMAVNDNRTIHGDCEVSYWIEAQFRRRGKQVGYLSEKVKVSFLYPHIRVSLARDAPFVLSARPDLLSRWRFQKGPDLSVTVYPPDTVTERSPQTGKRRLVLPLAATLCLKQSSAGTHSIESRQSMKCSASVKWETDTRFATRSLQVGAGRLNSGEIVQKITTASVQKHTILFRPLPQYDDRPVRSDLDRAQTSLVATSQLELEIPDAICQPSLDGWNFLARTYYLDVTLNFHGIQGAPKYNIQKRIPLRVSALRRTDEGVLKDDIAIDVLEMSDDESSVDGRSSDHNSVNDQAEPQGQRTPARRATPPPPYFP
ncbi:hypothetical protein PV08_10883 [Exophiala spinifera]|uniref:Arrestin-like N-terminal domain-containing protein n=1 Tax=Exophiala spinifera TaxID=91928 RepID=A0A0D1ZF42_9EURO|nr:uncharacterized protein PV08_10883 [Exophiala spinifera]KIW11582.1 hypothetical protein PV08_10883 [Exophiala spinifera]